MINYLKSNNKLKDDYNKLLRENQKQKKMIIITKN